MGKSKKQTKKQQASMQTDAIEMESWIPSDGMTMSGPTYTTSSIDDLDSGMSYSFGDLGQLDLFSEEDMREKYPALKQAYEHYQSVLEVCKTKEKEDEKPENLLTEPDETEGREDEEGHHDEASAISTGAGAMVSTGAMRGVTTPLGTGPTHPKKSKKKKKKSPAKAYGDSFARATPVGDIKSR